MDKYAGYVVITYAVTLAILAGYLLWMWLRLRRHNVENAELEREGDHL